jgi:transposase
LNAGDDAQAFASGRRLAAWIGLVPRQNSSGGRQRLGRITKHGQGELRRLLVQGARAVIIAANRHQGPPRHRLEAWIRTPQDRLHSNVPAVAVANRIARTAWVVMARDQDFESWPPRRAAA